MAETSLKASEKTNRLHRNLVGISALLCGIWALGLDLSNAEAFGIRVSASSKASIVLALLILHLYHLWAYWISFRADRFIS